jgi:hypothetical protein
MLAAIVSTAGKRFPLQLKRISCSMQFSVISQQREAILPLEVTEPVSSEKYEKVSATDVNELHTINCLRRALLGY